MKSRFYVRTLETTRENGEKMEGESRVEKRWAKGRKWSAAGGGGAPASHPRTHFTRRLGPRAKIPTARGASQGNRR
jgi:hypothetical protein